MTSMQYRVFSWLLKIMPDRISIVVLYVRRFKRFPRIKDPITFNEKLQYRKLFQRDEIFTIAADKLKSKDFVSAMVPELYIPKVLWAGSKFTDLKVGDLPDNYVVKANHASRTNLFIKNGQHLEIDELERLRRKWFKHDQYAVLGEWAYKDIEKKVFVEEFMEFDGEVPDDYKFFVYHGRVKYVQVDTGRFVEHRRNMFDENWNDLGVDYSYPRVRSGLPKPMFYSEMKEIAEKIGERFDFIRVDLFYYKKQVTFGELTVYPGAGFEKFPSPELDVAFGDVWRLG